SGMAARLVQRLLAFSRKQVIEPKIMNLNDHIAEIQRMLVRLIGEKIELRTVAEERLGLVKFDPGQFEQILVNLVVNSRDAMPEGGRIAIETANVDLDDGYCSRHPYVRPGRYVMMAVSDTGHGMTEEVRTHIFEPFFTTKDKGSGTGLGLAMIYGSVKQEGGSIEVYSEPGLGTTFKVYLPRVEAVLEQPKKEKPPDEGRAPSETVLVVEDDDMVRKICVRTLAGRGYRVLEASGGKEALAALNGHPGRIDMLLTDVVMPGMNGPELARRLRECYPEAVVLFASGYTEDTITHQGVLEDGLHFINKPYTPAALAMKVRQVLDRER
ncbi:MAG: ATP-binding protein, partial [Thermodesulfobacteriota bacterium]